MIVDHWFDVSIVEKVACVYDSNTKAYLGRVWIGKTGEWNVRHYGDCGYLPINACLDLLGYGKELRK